MRRCLIAASFILPTVLLAQPGALDPTFGTGGFQVLQPGLEWDAAGGVATLSDNSMLICGSSDHGDSSRSLVIHLFNDGNVDLAFGENGYAITLAGARNAPGDIVVMPDGGILIAGQTVLEPGSTNSKPFLAKFLPDGSPDLSFGTNGFVVPELNGADGYLNAIEVRQDGRFIVCGSIFDANFALNGLLMGFLENGAPDPSFSGDGVLVITDFTGDDGLKDIVELPDGRFQCVGHAQVSGNWLSLLVRVDPYGAVDTGFGNDGLLLPDLGAITHTASGVVALEDGFLICGSLQDVPQDQSAFVAGFHLDGTLVDTYGTGGLALVAGSAYVGATSIALDDAGQAVFCGYSGGFGIQDPTDVLTGRLLQDGTMDQSFGINGMVFSSVSEGTDIGYDVALQPDGRIVVAGQTIEEQGDILVLRYLSNGCAVFPDVSPSGLTLCPNSTGELSTGTYDTYQWYKNGLTIPGAISQTLPVTSADDVGSWFKVRTTIDTCFGFSDSVLVDGYAFLPPVVINAGDAPNLIGDNGEQIYCQGDDPVLVLGAPYDTNVQWSVFGEPIAGANDTLYAVPGSGNYTVEGAPSVCPDFIQDAGVTIAMDFHPYVQPTIYPSGILLCPEPEGLSSQWYYNGQPVAGFEQCVIPIDAGNYTVFVDYGDSCSVLSAPFFVVGLDEYAHTDMKASPVPTPDRVTITWTQGGPLWDWRVIDVTGRIVRSGTKTTSPLTIDLGALDVGRYRFLSGDSRSVPLAVMR